MDMLGRYKVEKDLFSDGPHTYYSATLDGSTRFVLKVLNDAYHPDFKDGKAQLQHEYHLFQLLNGISKNFPKAIEFIEENGQCCIVFLDEGFRPLEELLVEKKLTIPLIFEIAINLVKVLKEVHSLNIIHKNLTPRIILYHPKEKSVQLTGFSIATELKHVMVPVDPPRFLQGTLEYIAPEQTGRMNRPLTLRSDLYSLGVVFYEMMTGKVPFSGKEPMSIIFGHMATLPTPPDEINPEIPASLSKIVLKLLSKTAEDRYKSCSGLICDLEIAAKKYNEKQAVPSFTLGEFDVSSQPELLYKVYGREAETKFLFDLFDQMMREKESIVVTIGGYSGVGKSTLAKELIQKTALAKGFFAAGKYDKFQPSGSYEGLRAALDEVVRYHLGLPEQMYRTLRENIKREMGSLLPIITEFIPRLEAIVGKQPIPSKMGAGQARSRFELAILRFVKAICIHHPLVLFLDNVQWANHAMFALLQKITASQDVTHLFVILSYRSNEIDENHPFASYLREMKTFKTIYEIEIEGLKQEAVIQMLQEILYLPADKVTSLAAIIEKKTEGNPLFLFMFLEELYKAGELIFSPEKGEWSWDEARISLMPGMDNIVDFVNKRVSKLGDGTKNLLHIAACIGNTFTLSDLEAATESSAKSLLTALQPAVKNGFIIPSKLQDEWIDGVPNEELLKIEYRFQHDKIHTSCYCMKSLEETQQVHLLLARRWHRALKDSDTPLRKMAIVDQYNKGLSQVSDPEERGLICALNQEAGQIALSCSAHETAYNYHKIAKELLPSDCWENNYSLSFEVYLSFIKSSFLSHFYDASQEASEQLFSKSNNNLDKAIILHLKGNLARAVGREEETLSYFQEGLRLLGYSDIVDYAGPMNFFLTALKFTYLLHKNKASLEELPRKAEEFQDLVYQLVERIGEEYYFQLDSKLFAYSAIVWATTSFYKQSKILRTCAYTIRSILWPRNPFSIRLGKMAWDIYRTTPNSDITASSYLFLLIFHKSWHEPWHQLSLDLRRAAKNCEEAGNLDLYTYAYVNGIIYDPTIKCSQALKELRHAKLFFRDISPRGLLLAEIHHQFYRNMSGTSLPNCWEDEQFSENELLMRCKCLDYRLGETALGLIKLRTIVHFSIENIELSDTIILSPSIAKISGMSNAKDNLNLCFYSFLWETHCYPSLPFKKKLKSLLRIYALRQTVKRWVKFCPENFEHCYIFMRAEYARMRGRFSRALLFYDKAASLAAENESIEFAALAYNRALGLCASQGWQERAQSYFDRAIHSYEKWEASGVSKALTEKYNLKFNEIPFLETMKTPATSTYVPQPRDRDLREDYPHDISRGFALVSNAINKDIQFEKMLRNIIQVLTENVGATKCALCLIQKETFWVEGYYDMDNGTTSIAKHISLEQANLCKEIILQTVREKNTLLLTDLKKEHAFANNPYFTLSPAKCIISIPIVKADAIIGVIYCENSVSTNAFTTSRLDTLHALSQQLCSSIENSRLYTIFEKFTPEYFLNQLGLHNIFDVEKGDTAEKEMNVLFISISNFASYAKNHTGSESFTFINNYLSNILPIIHNHGGFIDKFLGDRVLVLFPDSSDKSLTACIEIKRLIATISGHLDSQFRLHIGIGFHFGTLTLGIVGGNKHLSSTVVGDAIHVASELESFNKVIGSECLITDDVKKRLSIPENHTLRLVGQLSLGGHEVWEVLDCIANEKTRGLYLQTKSLFNESYRHYLDRNFSAAKKGFDEVCKLNPSDKVAAFYSEKSLIYEKNPPPENWQADHEFSK